MGGDFITKWERHRQLGKIRFAAFHALGFSGLLIALKLLSDLFFPELGDDVTTLTILYFAIGGFAYGLIRFNIRERFYQATLKDKP